MPSSAFPSHSGLFFDTSPPLNISKVDPFLAKIASVAGAALGGGLSGAIFGAPLTHCLGMGVTFTPFFNLSIAMNVILIEHPKMYYASQFFLSAAMGVLSGFIGLAVVSLFTAALGNPFTLPAIIAASVSAAILLGVGIFVCQQFKTTEGMTNFLTDLFNPVSTFFTGNLNDRLKDIKAWDHEKSFGELGIQPV